MIELKSSDMELQRLRYLRNFRRELDELEKSSAEGGNLVSVLKRVLEEGDKISSCSASSLSGRVEVLVLMLREGGSLGSAAVDMRTMIHSRIRAATSAYPQTELYRLRAEELEALQEVSDECLSRTFELIPSNERNSRIRRALIGLFQKSTNKEAFFRTVKKIPSSQRSKIVESSFSFIHNNVSFWEFLPSFLKPGSDPSVEKLLWIVGFIPEGSRTKATVQNFLTLFRKDDVYRRSKFFNAVVQTPQVDIVDMVEKLLLFDRKIPESEISDMIRFIRSIPKDEREEVIRMTCALYRKTSWDETLEEGLEAVARISRDQRSDAAAKISLVLRDAAGWASVDVIDCIGAIPQEERAEVVRTLGSFSSKIAGARERTKVLKAVIGISRDQRSDVVKKTVSLFGARKSIDGYVFARILAAVYALSEDKRNDLVRAVILLWRGVDCDEEMRAIFSAVMHLPEDVRFDFAEGAARFSPHRRVHILTILGLFPKKEAKEIGNRLYREPDLSDKEDVYSYLFRVYPELKAVSGRYLMQEFQAAIGDHEKLQSIANLKTLYQAGGLEGESFLQCLEADVVYRFSFLKEVNRAELFDKYASEFLLHRPAVFWMSSPEEVLAKREEGVSITKNPFYLKMLDKYRGKHACFILQWLGYCEAVRSVFKISDCTGIWERLFTQIAKIRPPDLRNNISLHAFQAWTDPSTRNIFESEKFEKLFSKEHTQPFRLLAAGLFGEEISEATAALLSHDRYKDVTGKKIVLNVFTPFIQTNSLTQEEKKKCVRAVFSGIEKGKESSSVDRITRSLIVMESMCRLGEFAKLKEMEKPEDLEVALSTLFMEATGTANIDNFSDKYVNSFGSFRKKESLFVYAGKLKGLPYEERSSALVALKRYTEEVLNGTFASARYDESSSIHLKTVFAARPELKRLWTEGKRLKFEEIVLLNQETRKENSFDPKEFLRQRVITDRHIALEKVPFLAAYLQDSKLAQEELLARMEVVKKSPRESPLRKESDLLQLQKGLLSLLNAPDEERYEIFKIAIKPLIGRIFFQEELLGRDVTDLGSALDLPKKSASFVGWSVVDTDDPQDLLLCGTEIIGSCQSIHGSSSLNKCLLGYLLDGKNRLIAVKNEAGEIVARAIVRLLWDKEKKTPVLFKERIYSKPHADQKVLDVLHQMSLERAKELGLPLVVQESFGSSQRYPGYLTSLGSRAPFEYTDAGGGVTYGRFTVRGFEAV